VLLKPSNSPVWYFPVSFPPADRSCHRSILAIDPHSGSFNDAVILCASSDLSFRAAATNIQSKTGQLPPLWYDHGIFLGSRPVVIPLYSFQLKTDFHFGMYPTRSCQRCSIRSIIVGIPERWLRKPRSPSSFQRTKTALVLGFLPVTAVSGNHSVNQAGMDSDKY